MSEDSFSLSQLTQISFIGNGSFGEVLKVQDKTNGEFYAAKISLRYMAEGSDPAYRDLSREINILSRINHPSILKFIGFSPYNFHDEQKPVIVTEFLSNGSLYDIIELEKKGLCKDQWNDTRKLICIYGIASAMSYLHNHGIIHRDLKPANILMDDFLFPKIADFGLSKMKHQNIESMTVGSTINTIKGTPLYIAPEVWIKADFTPACDIYSFAIIVFEIMTCLEPWKDVNYNQLHTKVENGCRPEIPSYLPEAYKQLIEDCWEQDPIKRPSFENILERLRTDESFITPLVDNNDFLDYIDFIDNYKTTFGNKVIKIDQYIKRKSATFTRVTINNKNSNNNIKIGSSSSVRIKETMSKEKSKSKRFSLFKKSKNKVLYPSNEFKNLGAIQQQIVEESSGDPEKEFKIGKNLIEGIEDFPQNSQIGILYLEQSTKEGSIEAAIYYSELLIKGEVIPQDIPKAEKILKKYKKENSGPVLLLLGKIKLQQNDYSKASTLFSKSAKAGNAEGMYEYINEVFKHFLNRVYS